MMKPRVLITIDTYSIGGPGKVILQFLKYGGKEWCSPVVAGFWRGPEGKWQFREAVEALDVRFAVLRQKFAFDPFVIKDALRLVRENSINILESHGYKGHVVCLALKILTKLPWVAYVHGWTSENLKVGLYNQLDKTIVRFADKIVPVSEDLRASLNIEKSAGGKLVTIPNAADSIDMTQPFADVRERYGVAKNETLFCIVGRLSPEKGHRYFVEAFKIVSARYPDIKAVIVGDGQEREALAGTVLRNGLADRITLAGYQEDVSSFYQACDMVVLPSLREGMPMAALEAMMFAKPVIASDVGGIPEVVLDGVTGALVEPQNPAALAEALCGLLRDREKMRELGLAGKLRVEAEFNPRVRAQSIVKIYESLRLAEDPLS